MNNCSLFNNHLALLSRSPDTHRESPRCKSETRFLPKVSNTACTNVLTSIDIADDWAHAPRMECRRRVPNEVCTRKSARAQPQTRTHLGSTLEPKRPFPAVITGPRLPESAESANVDGLGRAIGD